VDRFGQSGDLPDLNREYRLDAEAIMEAVAGVGVAGAKPAAGRG
jgi:pyruvate dehydrogenase complex dehydrogenase (E1) component